MKRLKTFMASAALALSMTAPVAGAAVIIDFAQVSASLGLSGAFTGAGNTLTATDLPVLITTLDGTPVNLNAFLDLSASSTTTVNTSNSPDVTQRYTGNFSICATAIGCAINYLSSNFIDLTLFGTLGAGSGAGQISLSVSDPPRTVDFTSTVISTSNLADPSAFGFTLTGVTPALALNGSYFSDFGANLVGNASASQVPEPATLLLMSLGMMGLAVYRRRRG